MAVTEYFQSYLSARRVSFRVYGDRGQYRRPIVHRFPIKGGATIAEAMVENVVSHNSLFNRLIRKGR